MRDDGIRRLAGGSAASEGADRRAPRRGGRAVPAADAGRERFDAVLFDLDGVLTDTASLHA